MPSKDVKVVKKFRGLRQYLSRTMLDPEYAEDLLNCIVNESGELSKFRVPTQLTTPIAGQGPIPIVPFFDYTQANGTRQLVGVSGNSVYWWSISTFVATLAPGTGVTNPDPLTAAGVYDMVESNNLLFAMNGFKAWKWDGSHLSPWGLTAPAAAPNLVQSVGITTMTRAGNVVTAVFATPFDLAVASDKVTITSPNDASFNGTFAIATKTDQTHYTWAQTAANAGPVVGATAANIAQSPVWNIASIIRALGITTITVTASSGTTLALGPDFLASARVVFVVIKGADASVNGTFQLTSKQGAVFIFAQPDVADATFGAAGTLNGALVPSNTGASSGISWAYSYKDSIIGDESTASPSTPTAFGDGTRAISYQLTAVAPTNPKVDTICWYRTLDGGGDLFLEAEILISAGGLTLFDETRPDELDDQEIAPQQNDPPLLARYLASYGNRIFAFNIVNDGTGAAAPQDIIYSGYETILRGRPESCFPPFNRLRLAIGADPIAGGGVIQAGVVAFSISAQMFMFRGMVEDIVATTPVTFTAYLDQLPWKEGLWDHASIQSTPYGLVYLAADRCVKVFDGQSMPNDISPGVYPYLRRMTVTPTARANCRSAFFNLLERDWYAITLPLDGSPTPNYILVFNLNSSDNFGNFVVNVQADSLGVREDANGVRTLVISSQGQLYTLAVSSTNNNGIPLNPTSTSAILPAYWRGGYFGNDTPQNMKHHRWARLVTDGDPLQDGWYVRVNLYDDAKFKFRTPLTLTPQFDNTGRFPVNWKAKRGQVEIHFPDVDTDASVLEMQWSMIPLSDR